MHSVRQLAVIAFVLLMASFAAAQANELAVLGGGHFPINSPVDVDPGIAVQGNFAHRIFHVPLASIYLEVPVVATFNVDLNRQLGILLVPGVPSKYSALFVTPGLKLKLAPEFPLSPYFVSGGGDARFRSSDTGTFNDTSSSGVFDVGGGLDAKLAPFISLRGEVRDFYSGRPRLNISLGDLNNRQHNVVVMGGIVLRF
jgi:hypothetical protein